MKGKLCTSLLWAKGPRHDTFAGFQFIPCWDYIPRCLIAIQSWCLWQTGKEYLEISPTAESWLWSLESDFTMQKANLGDCVIYYPLILGSYLSTEGFWLLCGNKRNTFRRICYKILGLQFEKGLPTGFSGMTTKFVLSSFPSLAQIWPHILLWGLARKWIE